MEDKALINGRLKSFERLRQYVKNTPVDKRPEHLRNAEDWINQYIKRHGIQ